MRVFIWRNKELGINTEVINKYTNEQSPDEYQAAVSSSISDPFPLVRETVRSLLLSSPAYLKLDPRSRHQMARDMVRVSHAAATLLREEIESCDLAGKNDSGKSEVLSPKQISTKDNSPDPPPMAMAQAIGKGASQTIAGTTRAVLNAVSFPRFVTELINGVFKAMTDSSQQQMHSYVELLNNVAASIEGFADSNFAPARARAWLVERYPGSLEIVGSTDEDEGFDDEKPSAPDSTLRLRPGANRPSDEDLRTSLGLSENESIPSGDPERALVPFARRALAKQRQQMLATMVRLGMQRIVIESGRITASMRFHIDTRDAVQEDQASEFDVRHQSSAAGSFGAGPWGVSASMTNTIGYVNTQSSQTTAEVNTDLDLNSSVELNFKTDYLPLDRLSGKDRVDLIKANSLNPEAEARIASDERKARHGAATTSEANRRNVAQKNIASENLTPKTNPNIKKAEEKRLDAAKEEKKKNEKKTKGAEKTKPPFKRKRKQPNTEIKEGG